MNNGKISGNIAGLDGAGDGGGVAVVYGSFAMTGGVIYGTNADPASLKNIATDGAAVYNLDGNNKEADTYTYP
jgi:hypothetical protein